MKRLHVHIAVENLSESINFYQQLFACEPTVKHADYAKWMLDDPRVNFAISDRSSKLGLDHLGIQADDATELQAIEQNLQATQAPIETQTQTACCYSNSNKHWITDPQGIAWEAFHSLNSIPTFNAEKPVVEPETASACCPPNDKNTSCCG